MVVLTNPLDEGCKVATLNVSTTVITLKWGSRGRGHLVAPFVEGTQGKVEDNVVF